MKLLAAVFIFNSAVNARHPYGYGGYPAWGPYNTYQGIYVKPDDIAYDRPGSLQEAIYRVGAGAKTLIKRLNPRTYDKDCDESCLPELDELCGTIHDFLQDVQAHVGPPTPAPTNIPNPEPEGPAPFNPMFQQDQPPPGGWLGPTNNGPPHHPPYYPPHPYYPMYDPYAYILNNFHNRPQPTTTEQMPGDWSGPCDDDDDSDGPSQPTSTLPTLPTTTGNPGQPTPSYTTPINPGTGSTPTFTPPYSTPSWSTPQPPSPTPPSQDDLICWLGSYQVVRQCYNRCLDTTCDDHLTGVQRNCQKPPVCEQGCACKSGYVRDSNWDCISVAECEKKPTPPLDPTICPGRQMWSNCGAESVCQPTCEFRKYGIQIPCTKQCVPGCVCKPGFILNENGTCISDAECEDQNSTGVCKQPNTVFSACNGHCEKKCRTRSQPLICTTNCVPGCVCKPGYIRNDQNECIPDRECAETDGVVCYDDNNEEFDSCYLRCHSDDSCESRRNGNIFRCGQPNPEDCRPGCKCKQGYLRASGGRCISYDECDRRNGCDGPNEEWSMFNGGCQETCAVRMGREQAPVCDRQGVAGCVCRPGYVRNDNGVCISDRECATTHGIVCRANYNEVFEECYLRCHSDDDCERRRQGLVGRCAPPDSAVCEPGCKCAEGYLRDNNGFCISYDRCDELNGCSGREEWSIGNAGCQETCQELLSGQRNQCDQGFVTGCICRPGFVRNENGRCISEAECRTDIVCGINEILDDCSSGCQDTCAQRLTNRDHCRLSNVDNDRCLTMCVCAPGYIRNGRGRCISFAVCDSMGMPDDTRLCDNKPNQQWYSCTTPCPLTCSQRNSGIIPNCPERCAQGCECDAGFIFDDEGNCITEDACDDLRTTTTLPPTTVPTTQSTTPRTTTPSPCAGREVWSDCYAHCERDCDMRNQGIWPSCSPGCQEGCICAPGYIRNANGTCIPEDECDANTTTTRPPTTTQGPTTTQPQPECSNREVWSDCNANCQRTCYMRNNGIEYGCLPDCVAGCVCAPGYIRTEAGGCISDDECAARTTTTQPPTTQSPCTGREVWSDCQSHCELTCDQINQGITLRCSGECHPGCICGPGFVRSEAGGCISESECADRTSTTSPPTTVQPLCSGREVWSECQSHCEETCTQRNDGIQVTCTADCQPGCICAPGFVRTEAGGCISDDECSNRTTTTQPPTTAEPCSGREVWTDCQSHCEETCSQRNDGIQVTCTADCQPGCICAPGFVRTEAGGCISDDECSARTTTTEPPTTTENPCGEGMQWSECDADCRLTCQMRNDGIALDCSNECVPGCVCAPGYILSNGGDCITDEQCENMADDSLECPAREQYLQCGPLCPETCSFRNAGMTMPCPPEGCNEGCFCYEGWVMNDVGYCITDEDCANKIDNPDPVTAESLGTPGTEEEKLTTIQVDKNRSKLASACLDSGVCDDPTSAACKEKCSKFFSDYCRASGFSCFNDMRFFPQASVDACLNFCVEATPVVAQLSRYMNDEYVEMPSEPVRSTEFPVTTTPTTPGSTQVTHSNDHTSPPTTPPTTTAPFDPASCTGREVYSSCASACPETCDYRNAGLVMPCNKMCVERCVCRPGFVRNNNNICISDKECAEKNEDFADHTDDEPDTDLGTPGTPDDELPQDLADLNQDKLDQVCVDTGVCTFAPGGKQCRDECSVWYATYCKRHGIVCFNDLRFFTAASVEACVQHCASKSLDNELQDQLNQIRDRYDLDATSTQASTTTQEANTMNDMVTNAPSTQEPTQSSSTTQPTSTEASTASPVSTPQAPVSVRKQFQILTLFYVINFGVFSYFSQIFVFEILKILQWRFPHPFGNRPNKFGPVS